MKMVIKDIAVRENLNAREARKAQRNYEKALEIMLKTHQYKTYRWLKKNLSPTTDDLLDILSGVGQATVPLVIAGIINRITLIDPGYWMMLNTSSLAEKIQTIETPISRRTAHGSLPNIPNVTLIFTGLIFAPTDRAGSPEDWSKDHPNAKIRDRGLRGHIQPNVPNKVELTDVLRGLGDQKRVIWVADAPRLGLKEGAIRSRTHVEATLGSVDSGWKIAEWQSTDGEEMIFGKLVHE